MALMTEKRVRHLPVLAGQKAVGVISIGDLLKTVISKQKFLINELEHYITGYLAARARPGRACRSALRERFILDLRPIPRRPVLRNRFQVEAPHRKVLIGGTALSG